MPLEEQKLAALANNTAFSNNLDDNKPILGTKRKQNKFEDDSHDLEHGGGMGEDTVIPNLPNRGTRENTPSDFWDFDNFQ